MNDRQRLEAIVDVVRSYLPPDGISREEAMSQIIALVDPLPAQPEQEPVAWMHPDGKNYKGFKSPLTTFMVNGWTPLYTAPPSKPINFLLNGTRYKVTHQRYYGCSIVGLPENLNGQWVALVDATDDKHLQHTAPPSKPWVSLTDEEIETLAEYHGVDGLFETTRTDFARDVENILKGRNT